MVVENFKNTAEIYRRLDEKGRMMPEGLNYISSWIDSEVRQCFQLMETNDVKLFDEWIENWKDLADFKVIPVINSAEAREKTLRQL